MYTILITKKYVLDVQKNEDGTLLISNGDGKSVFFAGSLIQRFGGIDELLSSCIESDKSAEEIRNEKGLQPAITVEERAAQKLTNAQANEAYKRELENRYNELIKLDVIPSTVENITTLLYTLNSQNWGVWNLPNMEIGYSCNQYDCNGKIATTIVLDRPIPYDGELISRFEIGAPRGFLNKYRKLR